MGKGFKEKIKRKGGENIGASEQHLTDRSIAQNGKEKREKGKQPGGGIAPSKEKKKKGVETRGVAYGTRFYKRKERTGWTRGS